MDNDNKEITVVHTRMSKLVQVYARRECGRLRLYPANLEAELLCELLGRKTLNQTDVDILSQFDFQFEALPEIINFSTTTNNNRGIIK